MSEDDSTLTGTHEFKDEAQDRRRDSEARSWMAGGLRRFVHRYTDDFVRPSQVRSRSGVPG